MRLTILVDNNTLTDRYFLGEPGLSIHMSDGDRDVLLDAGYSDAFMRNADRIGIDLHRVAHVVLSHGHLDHSWGLDALIRQRTEAIIEGKDSGGPATRPVLTAHPLALAPRSVDNIPQIGAHLTREELARHFTLRLTDAPTPLTPRIHFLGEIPRRFDFEDSPPMGMRLENESAVPDTLEDDTGLALETASGLVVVTGCAHAGVCNTVEHARDVTGVKNVRSVIGGFHLLDASETRLDAVCRYLRELEPEALYPCHCTDLAARCALGRAAPVRDTGSGLALTF